MTDDRDLFWDKFAEDLEAATREDDDGSSSSATPRKTLSDALRGHERAIDQTMKAIDSVVGQMHDAAAHPEVKTGQVRTVSNAPSQKAELAPLKGRSNPGEAMRPAPVSPAAPSAGVSASDTALAKPSPMQDGGQVQRVRTLAPAEGLQASAMKRLSTGPAEVGSALKENRSEDGAHSFQHPMPQAEASSHRLREVTANPAQMPPVGPVAKPAAVATTSNRSAQNQPLKPEQTAQPSRSIDAGATVTPSTVSPQPQPRQVEAGSTRPTQGPGPASTIEEPGVPTSPPVATVEPSAADGVPKAAPPTEKQSATAMPARRPK